MEDPQTLAASDQEPRHPTSAGAPGVGLAARQPPATEQQSPHDGVVDHVELVQRRRNGYPLEPACHPGPVPIEFVGPDQRRRIFVTDVDRLWIVTLPKIGKASEIQA